MRSAAIRRATRSLVLPFALVLSLLVAGTSLAEEPPAAATAAAPAPEEMAQPFTAVGVDDAPFDLSAYLGKVPILLDFGSIYCSSCVQSIPHLIVLQKEYGDRLKIVGVNLDTFGLGRVKRFFSTFSQNLNFPILIDSGLTISKQYEAVNLPTYILISKEGKIVSRIAGYDDEIRQRMDRLIKKVVEGESLEMAEQKFEQDVVLLVPESFTKTFQRDIAVIGLSGNLPGPFTVKLNGGSERNAPEKKGMFHTRMPLSLGSNFLEVKYPKGSSTGTMAVVMFREPRMGEGLQVNFPEYRFHLPQKEEKCQACHKMDPAGEESDVAAMTDFCKTCHAYQTTDKFVHGPIPVGGCAACHDFTSKPHRYDITDKGTALCFTCHNDIQDKFERPNVHGPVAMGLCITCHSPHSSPFKFQLLQQQSTLCVSCHEDMRSKINKFQLHKPVSEERCTGCHDPHSSNSPNYFLRADGAELCYLCHTKETMKRHTHPVSGPPPADMPKVKLDDKGSLMCISCHDPHASDDARLLTVKGGCNGCHTL